MKRIKGIIFCYHSFKSCGLGFRVVMEFVILLGIQSVALPGVPHFPPSSQAPPTSRSAQTLSILSPHPPNLTPGELGAFLSATVAIWACHSFGNCVCLQACCGQELNAPRVGIFLPIPMSLLAAQSMNKERLGRKLESFIFLTQIDFKPKQ